MFSASVRAIANGSGKGGVKKHSMIHIIRSRATQQQMDDMLETLGTYIKVAVDVQQGILAGGGILHADCEANLLAADSQQEDIWGADWNPATHQVTFESVINIRPRQNNRSLTILDSVIRERVVQVIRELFEDV